MKAKAKFIFLISKMMPGKLVTEKAFMLSRKSYAVYKGVVFRRVGDDEYVEVLEPPPITNDYEIVS